jgi:DNA repair exonuclease SbcCD nuclease subunit
VVADIHLPYHDLDALEIALTYTDDLDVVLVNGDLLDFYKLSRFAQDPEAVGIAYELEQAKKFFEAVRELHPNARIIYKSGNHEDRLEKYLWTKPFTTLGALVGADDYGVEMVGSKSIIRCGKLNIIHGHEFGEAFFSHVNPARGLFLKAKCSTLAGHHHQTSDHSEGNINGDSMACWTIGGLCHLKPAYRPCAFTKWNHGFAIVELEESGDFTVFNKRIINERVH